jgi:hypothetical protein
MPEALEEAGGAVVEEVGLSVWALKRLASEVAGMLVRSTIGVTELEVFAVRSIGCMASLMSMETTGDAEIGW